MDKKQSLWLLLAGLAVGVAAVLLSANGNPANMGFCIACFLRDIAGGVKLHSAAVVQYLRPEIFGLVLGAFAVSLVTKEFNPRGGSAPALRFILGALVMIGALVFLGCPLRMVLRLAGGDLNALVALVGFVVGILIGVVFLNRGYSLGRTHKQSAVEGGAFSGLMVVLFGLLLAAPGLLAFSESGPGSMRAPIFLAFGLALVVGVLAQRTRLCMMGGIRDVVLFKDWTLLIGFIAVFAAALVGNGILNKVSFSFAEQPVAHTQHIWNFLGMVVVGYGSVLLGGCPLRQLILAGEGNSDSAVTVLGMIVGAAFAHNFGLASSAAGATMGGKVMVFVALAVFTLVALTHLNKE